MSGKRDSNSRPQPRQGCALPTELFPQLHGFVRRRTSPFRECKYKSLFGFKQTFPAKNFAFVSIFRYRVPRRRIGQSHKPTRCRHNQAAPQQASRFRNPATLSIPQPRRSPVPIRDNGKAPRCGERSERRYNCLRLIFPLTRNILTTSSSRTSVSPAYRGFDARRIKLLRSGVI